MGAKEIGLSPQEQARIVEEWRHTNPRIVEFWHLLEAASKKALVHGGRHMVGPLIIYTDETKALYIKLPSGRCIAYQNARVVTGSLVYDGQTATKGFEQIETYGGKLAENVVQAVSRDILAEAMLSLDALDFCIVAHVHDEVIVDTVKGSTSVDDVASIMCAPPVWAKTLPLAAAGFKSTYYRKG
jgi:DNA polymerase